ncbi:hypothetical protein BSLG_001021 [Batrachochytrium salamandrivorans]|nr:hypothetical protein BSLG_001021 [Batrachochytrium salamandrivorans]
MPDDDLSLSSQDDTNMSDIDDSLSEISDHMDSDVDMTSSSIVLQTNHNPAVGGKGLPISLATQYSEGIYDYEDADDDLDIPEVEAIVEDDKDVIGAQYDEDLLDDDIDDDDAILSDAENEPEDSRFLFAFSTKGHQRMRSASFVLGVASHLRLLDSGMGYYHTEWLMRSELELERGSKNRIRKFLEKPSWDHYSEDEPFNPSFSKIDRIIDVGEHGNKIMYLVKWCAQAYEYSTWESQDLIEQIDIDKISEYNDRNSLKPIKRLSYNLIGRHHPAGRWVKLENSPIYKNDNMLRSYQLEGLDWLMFCWYNKQNSILADEMGLGKTVQSTVFLYQLFLQENLRGPFLIVTPLSTIGNWEREIRGWTDMNVVVYHGNQPSRNLIVETEYYYRDETGAIIPDMLKFDVILTTYEMAMSGAAQLRPILALRSIGRSTPSKESVIKGYGDTQNLHDGASSEMDFKINYGSLTTAADVEKLQNVLKPLMLRRLKEDVEKTIPVKEETIVEVELTTTQKKWYRSILEKNFSWLKQGTLKKTNVPNLINTMIELRKCCIHPWLLKGAEDQILDELHARSHEQQFNALIQSSGKMVLIDKLLKKLKQGDHKVLIFSQMTKCLDLIQDYLRGRAWIFERIDGGVRGDLRQAAIDRFSAPGSESFVFLLCTRAGGVGINLTAADTCIIFDSDWNPQNDLQAQSRCHRIGQKKPVQIYRLITRNTYEREMFDRASMKLGLDKALLQRMDMQGESGFSGFDAGSSKSNALSTEEVEELLKKGAYGAFMDDEASKQFCEEDIDQILERRTQVIRHDSKEEKSSIFQKPHFKLLGVQVSIIMRLHTDVDVNDPDFWDKVAKQAELQIVEDIPEEFLIMDMPRNRRQVNRFGVKKNDDVPVEVVHSPSVHDDPPSVQTSPLAPVKVKDELKLWSLTERTRLERMLMQHGFNSWQRVRDSFARRSIYDLQACCRVLLNHCLNTCTTVEPDVIKDVKRAMQCFLPLTTEPEFEPTSDELECRTFLLHENGEEIEPEEPVELPEEQQPYPWANERQISEFNSFWKEANKEYIEHIERKAKNMLIRVFDVQYPKQQKYSKLWEDPNLCFYETFQRAALGGIIVEANATDRDGAAADEDADDNAAVDGVSAVTTLKDEVEIEESSRSVQSTTNNGIEGDVDMDPSASSVLPESNSLADSALPPASDDPPAVAEPDKFVIPSATDLGVRVRRILNSMSKHRQYLIRELARKESVKERTRQRDSERAEKMKLRDKDFQRSKNMIFSVFLHLLAYHGKLETQPRLTGHHSKSSLN